MRVFNYIAFIVVYYLGRAAFSVPESLKFYISFLDVGQGDSIVINVPRYGQILLDTGADYQSNYLSARGSVFPVCGIRAVFITHYDNDHSGGLERVQRFCKDVSVYDNVSFGDVIRVEDVYLYVLNPLNKVYVREENDDSLVMLLKKGDFEALLTGDAGLGVLQRVVPMIEGYKTSGIISGGLDVYKVSHHGSLHNSSFSLFSDLSPSDCVISVGKNNYGHPSGQVLEDIQDVGCRLHRTDKNGTTSFTGR